MKVLYLSAEKGMWDQRTWIPGIKRPMKSQMRCNFRRAGVVPSLLQKVWGSLWSRQPFPNLNIQPQLGLKSDLLTILDLWSCISCLSLQDTCQRAWQFWTINLAVHFEARTKQLSSCSFSSHSEQVSARIHSDALTRSMLFIMPPV